MSRIRVLVVDDSVVVRRLVSDVLARDPDIEVAGTASNGELALAKLAQVAPDLVTMDVEMPVLDGISTVRRMRADGSRLPIIMFSTLTGRGAVATLDALGAGASDYVTKPANVGSVAESMEQIRTQLIPRIKALVPRSRPVRTAPAAAAAPPLRAPRTSGYDVLAVGCSTGGPEALPRVLAALPGDLAVPVLVVQHMPPVFTAHFAARLDAQLPLTVAEALPGAPLRPGHVYLAPGDYHLAVMRRGGRVLTELGQGAPENFCRPAVDVLFRSVAAVYGARTLAAVLTGMGHDGCLGARAIVEAGGSVLVQDQGSSVVWGMPGAVAAAGLAEAALPPAELGGALATRLPHRQTAGAET